MYLLNSLCDIVVPFTRCSCSDSAWNMQFPEPSLSEIRKPLSDAILSNSADRASLSQELSASHCICCRFWNNCPSSSKKKHYVLKKHCLFHFSRSKNLEGCLVHETPNKKGNSFSCFRTQLSQKSIY